MTDPDGMGILARLENLQPSLIRELHGRKQPGDIDLGLGEPVLKPDLEPFRKAMDWVAAHGCPYSPTNGFGSLREQVATYAGAAPDQVIITHGSQEALYLGLRLLAPRPVDEVLLVEPCYPAYAKICEMEGIPYRVVALSASDGFAPRARAVLEALTPGVRAVVLSSPCNPTGRIWPRAELEALAAGLGDRWILSDEVYRELSYTDEAPTSARRVHERTVLAGGLSKSHALTGLRMGWLVSPPLLAEAASRMHQLMTTSASSLSQRVALEIMARPGGMGTHRSIYRARRERLLEALRDAGLEHVEPDGAFYCLVRIPDACSDGSLRVALDLLEREHVVTIPGVAFGVSCDRYLRISWVVEPDLLVEGIGRMQRFLLG